MKLNSTLQYCNEAVLLCCSVAIWQFGCGAVLSGLALYYAVLTVLQCIRGALHTVLV